MTQKDIIVRNFRHFIYRAEGKKPDLAFELVADFVYTLDIDAYKFQQGTVVHLIMLAKDYDEYLTHELLKNNILRIHFEVFEP